MYFFTESKLHVRRPDLKHAAMVTLDLRSAQVVRLFVAPGNSNYSNVMRIVLASAYNGTISFQTIEHQFNGYEGSLLMSKNVVGDPERVAVNGVDANGNFLVGAGREKSMVVWDLKRGEKVYHLLGGSKSVKTHLEDPLRPGITEAKLSESKILAVIGNIMRVYSFDN